MKNKRITQFFLYQIRKGTAFINFPVCQKIRLTNYFFLYSQEKSLNAAWFVFGTKSELKAQKILQSGDVLKSADFNKDYFTQIDIRTTKEIKLYSKRAELLTTHPTGSYELVKDDKGQLTLKITNPTEFWSVSRYLVIQVK